MKNFPEELEEAGPIRITLKPCSLKSFALIGHVLL